MAELGVTTAAGRRTTQACTHTPRVGGLGNAVFCFFVCFFAFPSFFFFYVQIPREYTEIKEYEGRKKLNGNKHKKKCNGGRVDGCESNN